MSKQDAERYVVKVDQNAQTRIDSLIREAHSNSYTLYILVHDHAHWDINRCCVCMFVRERERETNLESIQNLFRTITGIVFNQHNNLVQCLQLVSLSLIQCILQ